MEYRAVGIVGAGVIGNSLAEAIAIEGLNVFLLDVSESLLDKAREDISKNLRLHAMMSKKKLKEDTSTILDRITYTLDMCSMRELDFIIECVTEDWEIKKKVFSELDKIVNENCIIASNTSCIPISKLASIRLLKDKVIGLHFMNPVPLISRVELIKGTDTSKATIELTKEFLSGINKDWVVVNDSPGFVSNRILMVTINEAIFTFSENVASVRDIDQIFKTCFGHKMGPLETADLIGLDTILLSIEVLYNNFNDKKYLPCPLLKEMVDAGKLGRKSGQGFYDYYTG